VTTQGHTYIPVESRTRPKGGAGGGGGEAGGTGAGGGALGEEVRGGEGVALRGEVVSLRVE